MKSMLRCLSLDRLQTVALIALLFANTTFAAQPAHLLDAFSRGNALIETSGPRCLLIDLYFANTAEQQSQGLMYVRELDEQEGMLFVYRGSRRLTMWMKNTYLSLDMLFLDSEGAITKIAARTTPLSTERISSDGPAAAVLELNAGFTERWLIEPGNRLLAVNVLAN